MRCIFVFSQWHWAFRHQFLGCSKFLMTKGGQYQPGHSLQAELGKARGFLSPFAAPLRQVRMWRVRLLRRSPTESPELEVSQSLHRRLSKYSSPLWDPQTNVEFSVPEKIHGFSVSDGKHLHKARPHVEAEHMKAMIDPFQTSSNMSLSPKHNRKLPCCSEVAGGASL